MFDAGATVKPRAGSQPSPSACAHAPAATNALAVAGNSSRHRRHEFRGPGGFRVIPGLGHGISRTIHEPPSVPNLTRDSTTN